MPDPAAAGRRLKEARTRAGLSQRQLAFPGCSPSYIARIEAGQRIASWRILRELGKRLEVSDEYLATGRITVPFTALADAEVALRLDEMEEAARLFEVALKDAPGDPERSRALEGLGQIAFRGGNPELAVELFEKALSLVGDDVSERPALAQSLARSYASLGRLARSIAVLELCVEAYTADPVQYVRFAGFLGAALTDNGNFAEAERVLASALERGRDIADRYTRARLYWSESRLHFSQGRSEEAAGYAHQALALVRATEDDRGVALLLQTLAHIYLDLERPQEALEFVRDGKALIEELGTPLEVAQYRIEEARALAALGEKEEAAALAMQVGNELEGTHPVDSARSYTLLGEIFADLGERERAREVLELAVELLEQRPPTRYLVQAYRSLASLLKSEGDTEGALDVLERAFGVQERVGRPIV